MIKQVNDHVQDKYAIRGPNIVKLAKAKDYTKKRSMFFKKLDSLRNTYGLKDKDTIAMYHQAYWNEIIQTSAKKFGYKIPKQSLVKLIKRWAFFDKSYSIRDIKKDFEKNSKFLEWVLKTDKEDHKHLVKDNMRPFEVLFSEVAERFGQLQVRCYCIAGSGLQFDPFEQADRPFGVYVDNSNHAYKLAVASYVEFHVFLHAVRNSD